MVKIRLLRRGRKGQPFFSIIAIDSRRSPKSEKMIKKIGYYNPIENDFNKKVKIRNFSDLDKLLSNGAQMSITVKNILKKLKSSV